MLYCLPVTELGGNRGLENTKKESDRANPANELQAAVNMMIPGHMIMLTIVKTILVRQSPACEESGRSTSKKLGNRKSLHQ
jgi:hypothetical protein